MRSRLLLITSLLALAAPAGCTHQLKPPSEPAIADRSGAAAPIEDYRRARYREAVRGLKYDSGFVEFDADADAVRAEAPAQATLDGLLQQAADMLNRNRNTTAIKLCTTAVLLFPDAPAAYDLLGRSMVAKRKTAKATAAFRTALRLDPDLMDTRYRLGAALWMQNEIDEAMAEWQRLLERDPDHTATHQRLAVASYYLEDYTQAWRHVRAVQAVGSQVPPQFRNLLTDKMPEPQS